MKWTCHFTQENLDLLEDKAIYIVQKNLNPSNKPQIWLIEMYWGALKQMVYAKNLSAKNFDQLMRKIKKCTKEMDSQIYLWISIQKFNLA